MPRPSGHVQLVSTPRVQADIVDSLLASAQANRKHRGPRCWMCSLPAETLKSIHAAYQDNPGKVMSATGEVRVTDAKTGGQKGSKPQRYDQIPPEALDDLAALYGWGCSKYAARNWERGYAWGLSFAAMMRHAWAWWRGEEVEPESGLDHMAHVAWHAMALHTYRRRGLGTDDRALPPRWPPSTLRRDMQPTDRGDGTYTSALAGADHVVPVPQPDGFADAPLSGVRLVP